MSKRSIHEQIDDALTFIVKAMITVVVVGALICAGVWSERKKQERYAEEVVKQMKEAGLKP